MLAVGCRQAKKPSASVIRVDLHWLDSVKQKADTVWSKPYRSEDFATADYYVDRKDSIVTQVMKDINGTIRQIIAAKYDNIRRYVANYYPNGQLMAKLPLDSLGRYHGKAETYYPNGMLKSSGFYEHGFYTGEWLNYDSTGKSWPTDRYDANGQLIK